MCTNIVVQKPLVHKTVNLNQVYVFLYLEKNHYCAFFLFCLRIIFFKNQVNLYFCSHVPIAEGLHAYAPFDQERPCLCILSEHFCTDVLYCKIIY